MAGIYLHIPFCKQKCHYCNFFSVVSLRHRDDLVNTLLREIEWTKTYLNGETVNTIYFGGGTPSLLKAEEVNRIIDAIRTYHPVTIDAEITLEANPDDLTPGKLESFQQTPVNRLSIGIQSFRDEDLRYLNRVHDARQALASVRMAQEAGFTNLTIDLIYGIPTLDQAAWENNIESFLGLEIPHLSAYALTVEDKTALAVLIKKGKLAPVDDEQSARDYELLQAIMEQHHFIHYEISNFAREGFYSKHNSLYWLGGHYLGLGPSAHSFNGRERQWNASHMAKYMALSKHRETAVEREVLSSDDRYNEYIMTSLRTVWGCDAQHILNVFGEDYHSTFKKDITPFLADGLVTKKGHVYYLSPRGKFLADGIASKLFRC